MKALSLWQPWASAIAEGIKRVETRAWATAYRGPLAIHAAKRWDTADQRLIFAEMQILKMPRFPCPLGAIVATCRLVECVPTDQYDPSETERFWGTFVPGRFAWILTKVQKVEPSVPMVGRRGVFEVTALDITEKR